MYAFRNVKLSNFVEGGSTNPNTAHSTARAPWGEDIGGAVIMFCPEMPVYLFNNASNVNVNEDEAENLVNRVTNYFSSRKFPFACFRISPLTHPDSFTHILEQHGFERNLEYDQSVMVFQEKSLVDRLNPTVYIKEISEDRIDIFSRLVVTIFEMPNEWKKVLSRFIVELMRKEGKNYLAYIKGEPVGTATLFSLLETGGIFNVGTLKELRERGVGSSIIAHAILDSIDEGNSLHTLQAEKGGYAERFYQDIGFEIDHTISYLSRN